MTQRTGLRIAAVGDLSFNGRFHRLSASEWGYLWPLTPAWQQADLRLGNLEAPITSAPRAAPTKLALRAPVAALAFLKETGFDSLCLANNHMMDFGPAGLAETLDHLARAGLPALGAGENDTAARAPQILTRHGQAIGLIAWCAVAQKSPLFAGPAEPGVAAWRLEQCLQEVRALRSQVDWLIVQLHWGEELAQLPSPQQRAWARQLVQAGADLILGHHAHVLQPLELIDGVPVCYSLGNFFFSDMYWRGRTPTNETFVSRYRLHPLSRQTGWIEVHLQHGQPAAVRLHPTCLNRDLRMLSEDTPPRQSAWADLCRRLQVADYEVEYAAEHRRAQGRLRWQSSWRSPLRRFELLLFRHGLLPHAVEGV